MAEKLTLSPAAKIKRAYQLNHRLVSMLATVAAQRRNPIEEVVGAAIHAFIKADDAEQNRAMKSYVRWVDSNVDEIKRGEKLVDHRPS